MTDPNKSLIVPGKLVASQLSANPIINLSPYPYDSRTISTQVRLKDLDGEEALEAIQYSVTQLLRTRMEEAESVCEEEPEDEHAYGELYALKETQKALNVLFRGMPDKIYSKSQTPHPFSHPKSFKW